MKICQWGVWEGQGQGLKSAGGKWSLWPVSDPFEYKEGVLDLGGVVPLDCRSRRGLDPPHLPSRSTLGGGPRQTCPYIKPCPPPKRFGTREPLPYLGGSQPFKMHSCVSGGGGVQWFSGHLIKVSATFSQFSQFSISQFFVHFVWVGVIFFYWEAGSINNKSVFSPHTIC